MSQPVKIVALFFALLITFVQIRFGSCVAVDGPLKTSPVHKSIPVLSNQSLNAFAFSDPRESIQTLIECFVKGLSKISAPDWFRTNLSAFYDPVASCTAYLAMVSLLPYRHETPLIVFPFHNFW